MASDQVIDIEALCAPVSEDRPAGPYWRDDADIRDQLYSVLDSAKSDAQRNQRKIKEMYLFPEGSVERRNYAEPDWGKVVEAATDLLYKSKDLWAAAWLMEALARRDGFRGLRDGLALIYCLCQRFWDQIHPRPDSIDGVRFTLAQLDGNLLAELVPLMPITGDGMTTADYDQSTEMDGLPSDADRDTYRQRGVISIAEFEARVGNSGAEFLSELIEDAQAARDGFVDLFKFLDDRCGDDAPASTKAAERFQETLDLVVDLAEPFLPQADEDDTDNQSASSATGTGADGRNRDTQQKTGWDRDQAFSEISRQAALFEKYEPNSPVASVLRQAVYLGKLSWSDMMSVLADDPNTRSQILKLTGVREESSGKD